MLEDCAKVWWDDITGPATYVQTIVDNLVEAKATVLVVPADIPWHDQLYRSTEEILRKYDPDLLLEFIDCQYENFRDNTGKINIASYLLDRYAYPEVKSGYRQSSGRSMQQYLVSKHVLLNRVIWVKNTSAEIAVAWVNFCRGYRVGKRYDGLFVIETTENILPHGTCNSSNILDYNEFTSYYDTLLFNNMVCSQEKTHMEWLQYKAAVSALICDKDAELSKEMLLRSNCKTWSPIEVLRDIAHDAVYTLKYDMKQLSSKHPLMLIQSNETKVLNHSLWKAQLQMIFPLIEAERIQIIKRYRDEIEEAINTEYFDFLRYVNRYVTQYGERIESAFDVEIGTLYRMNHLRCAADTSLYLFFLPKEEDRMRLSLLHNMRNSIAHIEPCAVEIIAQFFSQYPYAW